MFTSTNLDNIAGFMLYRVHLHSLLAHWIRQISIFLQAAQPDGGLAIRNLNDALSFCNNPKRNNTMIMCLRKLIGFSFDQSLPDKVSEPTFLHLHF